MSKGGECSVICFNKCESSLWCNSRCVLHCDVSLLSVKKFFQQIDAVIAASKSVMASKHLRKVLEVILAFGNYMNSSKRGGVFGFKLQSLDIVS